MEIHCYAALEAKQPLVEHQYNPDVLGPWDIEVAITHCGLCYTDIHFIDNAMGNSTYPMIPGHEIIGTVLSVGSMVDPKRIGTRVGIGFQRSSCMDCEWCGRGQENVCTKQQATCLHHPGGFAERIIADSRFAFPIPEGLKSEVAAPLLCGGATVFTPLIEYEVSPLKKVGVVGIGGLGHLAVQFARAFGCEVTAFTSSLSKVDEAKEFGAHHVIVNTDPKELLKAANSLDFILCTVSIDMDWNVYLKALRPNGVLCFVGMLEKPLNIPFKNLVRGCKAISAGSIGSRPEIKDMLNFAALHNIQAKIELYPMSDINKAIDRLRKNQVRYRAVLVNP